LVRKLQAQRMGMVLVRGVSVWDVGRGSSGPERVKVADKLDITAMVHKALCRPPVSLKKVCCDMLCCDMLLL
jgi:hypothetical protein